MARSKNTFNLWTFVVVFFVLTLWDVITSGLGLLSIFGMFELDSNKIDNVIGIFTTLVQDNSIGFVFSLILGFGIVALDNLIVNNYQLMTVSNLKQRGNILNYLILLIWSLFKSYDLYSTYIGTARCFIDTLFGFPNPGLAEIFDNTTTEQQIVLLLISLVVVSSPVALIALLNKINTNISNST